MVNGNNHEKYEGITLVPSTMTEYLHRHQVYDYREYKRDLIKWACNVGKSPKKAEGYAHDTVKRRSSDINVFFRFIWKEKGAYTTTVTADLANAYLRELAYTDYSDAHKANILTSLKMLLRYEAVEWTPEINFHDNTSDVQPRDYLTRRDRKLLREASLDFDRCDGFKFPSLVYVSLDAGLRPIEVSRAKVSWIDLENDVLRIPAEQDSKGNENRVVSVQTTTTQMLKQWLEERALYEKYDGSDRLWLTRESQPYSSQSLNYLLDNLIEEAGIDTENRDLTWYALRHSTGTYLSREDGLVSAASQLRHKSIKTTAKYDNSPPEERRKALERIE